MIYNVGGVWAMQTRTYVNEKVYILKKYGGGVSQLLQRLAVVEFVIPVCRTARK